MKQSSRFLSEPTGRRTFLRLLVAVGGATTLGLLGLWRWKSWALNATKAWYYRLLSPGLEDGSAGMLDASVARALVASTEALVDSPIDTSRYEEFFRWRAANVPGYRNLYEKFAVAIDAAAGRAGGGDFADHAIEARRNILARLLPSEERYAQLLSAIVRADHVRFDRYIVGEVIELFNNTDAWTLLGYDGWPGSARGLERYTHAPSSVG